MKKNLRLHLILPAIILALGLAASSVEARKVTTRLKAPTTTKEQRRESRKVTTRDTEEFDSVRNNLTFMGYDKKTSAAKETFFVDNSSDTSLSALELEISYYNSTGKLIHKRKVEIKENLPAKETRKVDIPSWDTQKSYHYEKSVPSTKGSTPYTVKFKVVSFIKGQ